MPAMAAPGLHLHRVLNRRSEGIGNGDDLTSPAQSARAGSLRDDSLARTRIVSCLLAPARAQRDLIGRIGQGAKKRE